MAQFGISVALLSPLQENGALDTALLAAHAQWCLGAGPQSITLFGTTGEGASFGLAERGAGIAALTQAGIAPDQIILGLCGNSVEEVAAQTAQGRAAGIKRFLVPPPFYFADASDAGLFAWFAALFTATDLEAGFILYHIPQVTGVALSHALIERLMAAFGERIIAIKDSSGSWDNARILLERKLLPVLVGDERVLHRTVPMGGAGSICGLANLYPKRMCRLFDTGQEDADLSREVDRVVSGPVIPTLKILIAQSTGETSWERVRAPLVPLDGEAKAALRAIPLLGDAYG